MNRAFIGKGISVLGLLVALLPAHAVVKTNYGFSVGYNPSTKEYSVSIQQTPTNGDYTCGSFFHTVPRLLTSISLCVDESSEWYYGTYGQTFDNAAVSNGAFEQIVGVGTTNNTMRAPVGYSYIAVRTSTPGNLHGPRDIFGWALLSNGVCSVSVVDRAFAYDEGSITIGEPASFPVPPTGAEIPTESNIQSHEVYARVTPGYKGMMLRMAYTSSVAAGVTAPMWLQAQSSTNPSVWTTIYGPLSTTGMVDLYLYQRKGTNNAYEPEPVDWRIYRIYREENCPP